MTFDLHTEINDRAFLRLQLLVWMLQPPQAQWGRPSAEEMEGLSARLQPPGAEALH